MKITLSKRLSPQAKKAAILGPKDKMVKGLLQVAPNADLDAIKGSLTNLHATYGSWNKITCQLQIEVPAAQLNAVAGIRGVVYLEAATSYSH
jgi:hypothetical protein